MPRVYAIKADVVDRVLGAGVHAAWQDEVQDAFAEEQTRAYANENRYKYPWAASLRTQLQADIAFAEKVFDDYATFLERTSISGTADVTQGEKILSVLLLAISILTSVNDLLDSMFGLGIVALVTTLSALKVDMEARKLQELLKKLQQQLERAKREVTEAWAQTIFNGVISVALLCSGPLGWLSLGAIGLTQIVVDTYVGPSTSDAATWGSRGTTTVGTAVSASQKYLAETSKVLKVVKPAGKAIPVVGFVFDVNELSVGYRNVDQLKAVMAEVKAAHQQLIASITQHKATFSALVMKVDQLGRDVAARSNGWTGQIRQTLEAEMARTGYRPRP